jgi:hypothetical protein
LVEGDNSFCVAAGIAWKHYLRRWLADLARSIPEIFLGMAGTLTICNLHRVLLVVGAMISSGFFGLFLSCCNKNQTLLLACGLNPTLPLDAKLDELLIASTDRQMSQYQGSSRLSVPQAMLKLVRDHRKFRSTFAQATSCEVGVRSLENIESWYASAKS